MSTPTTTSNRAKAGPPTKHQLALMIWLAVFPTLTVLNLALGDWLSALTPVLRTFVLATIAVPIVIYGLMPQLCSGCRPSRSQREPCGWSKAAGTGQPRDWPR